MEVRIHPEWKAVLKDEFEKPYFGQIVAFSKTEKALGKTIYPPGSLIFNAFNQTGFDKVKSGDIRTRPIPRTRSAMGLSFRSAWSRPPPSLVNIFSKELKSDLGLEIPVVLAT